MIGLAETPFVAPNVPARALLNVYGQMRASSHYPVCLLVFSPRLAKTAPQKKLQQWTYGGTNSRFFCALFNSLQANIENNCFWLSDSLHKKKGPVPFMPSLVRPNPMEQKLRCGQFLRQFLVAWPTNQAARLCCCPCVPQSGNNSKCALQHLHWKNDDFPVSLGSMQLGSFLTWLCVT